MLCNVQDCMNLSITDTQLYSMQLLMIQMGLILKNSRLFLRMKDKVEVTKEISHEDASKKIGEEEYEKYVKPLVEESSSSSS